MGIEQETISKEIRVGASYDDFTSIKKRKKKSGLPL
jgi:hypothetical protein